MHDLLDELRRRVLAADKRHLRLTPADAKVWEALAGFRGPAGWLSPGFRAIAREAGVALGTVTHSTRRLRAAGWLSWRLVVAYHAGRMVFRRRYSLPIVPPPVRSRFGAQTPVIKKSGMEPRKPARSVARQMALAQSWERRPPQPAHGTPAWVLAARARLRASPPACWRRSDR